MKLKPKIDNLIHIVFYDHAQSTHGTEPIKCQVAGILTQESKIHYTVTSWDVMDTSVESKELNNLSFAILKSTIVDMTFISLN